MKHYYIAPSTETQYLHINMYMQTLSSQIINYGGETTRFDSKVRLMESNVFELNQEESIIFFNEDLTNETTEQQ